MELNSYIGYPFDYVKQLLDKDGISYSVMEVWDVKKTKLGDDFRVINIKNNDGSIIIYASYF